MGDNKQAKPLVALVRMDTEEDRQNRRMRLAYRQQVLVSNQGALEHIKKLQIDLRELRAQRRGVATGTETAIQIDLRIDDLRIEMDKTASNAQMVADNANAAIAMDSGNRDEDA